MTDDPIRSLMGVYSKKYNCIFIRVPRTGTGSLGSILNIGGGHMPITQMKRQFEQHPPTGKKWDEVFKFGFCRNPYTRFISAWYNLGFGISYEDKPKSKDAYTDVEDLNKFLENPHNIDQLLLEENVLFSPVHKYLCNEKGDIMVDHVGRFEDLHNEWNYIFEKLHYRELNGENPVIVHSNRINIPKQKLNKRSKALLYKMYEKDFKIFKYE